MFVVTESNSLHEMFALLLSTPVVLGVTFMVTVALPAIARLPSKQVTKLLPVQEPWLVLTIPGVTPAGNVLVNVQPVAVNGPELVTVAT